LQDLFHLPALFQDRHPAADAIGALRPHGWRSLKVLCKARMCVTGPGARACYAGFRDRSGTSEPALLHIFRGTEIHLRATRLPLRCYVRLGPALQAEITIPAPDLDSNEPLPVAER